MNDLSWGARRAAARWLFCGRRMELVAEEVGVSVAPTKVPLGPAERVYAEKYPDADYRRVLTIRSADVLGFTRERTKWSSRKRELRIVEVKVSRADLLGGIRKGQVGNGPGGLGSVADFCHLLIPKDMRIDLGELPDRWGLLVFDPAAPPQNAVYTQKPARRLSPTVAIEEDRLVVAIQQSVQWKLYSYDTTITVRRYRTGPGGYGWEPRDINPDGGAA